MQCLFTVLYLCDNEDTVCGIPNLVKGGTGVMAFYPFSSFSNIFAFWRSAVSKPSVNQS